MLVDARRGLLVSGCLLAGGAAGSTYGLWRSTHAGATFARVSDVGEGDAVGCGKAASGVLINGMDTTRRGYGANKAGRYRYTQYNYESILPDEQ